MPNQTPSQTIGPFFHYVMPRGEEGILTTDRTLGQRITLTGRLLDGDGNPISDGFIEIWQADSQGYFNHPTDPNQRKADKSFRGFGRCSTNKDGEFWFKTVKPGPVEWEAGMMQAPHISVRVFARGMLNYTTTRLYFSDEPANDIDPVLNSLPEPERKRTLIATLQRSEDLPCYCFDIHLQGEDETVFFSS